MTKLRGAFIGFGKIAELGHWPSYAASREAEIVAVMDPSPERQKIAEALSPNLHAYGYMDDLFRDQKLDFVDICTPPSSHAELALKALSHGCHVLCEKPLTLKPAEYAALAQAMAKAKKTVFTVHNWKCAPIFQKAFDLIKEGRIGRVWHADIFTLRNNVCQGATSAQDATDWRKNAAIAGGGILVDHGWHAFYLLKNLVGAEPQKVLAKMATAPDDPEGLEETAQVLVQFPEADGYIHLTWRAETRRNTAAIQGQAGSLLIDDDRILLNPRNGKPEEIKFGAALSAGSHHADWFETLLPQFLEEIKNPAKRGANFQEAGWCLGLTSAAYQSNLQGFKEIEVSLPGSPKRQAALA